MQFGRRPTTTSTTAFVSRENAGAVASSKLVKVIGLQLALLLLLLATLPPEVQTFNLDLNEPPPIEDDSWNEVIPAKQHEPVEVKEAPEPAKKEAGRWALSTWMNKASTAVKSSLANLPKYFDFDQFQRKFKRRYSPSEFIYRKAAFLKRCYQVFKARVSQRLGQMSYTLGINKFADRSPNEIKQLFMSGPPIEFRPEGQSEEEYYRELERVNRERSVSDLELDSRAAADGSDELDELEVQIFNEQQAQAIIEQLQAEAALEGNLELRMAIRDELRGAESDSYSQAAATDMPGRPLPWPGQQKAPEGDSEARADERYQPPELDPDEEGLDWSMHPCFHMIYDQGEKCGRCYVMASTTLAEFYKCSEIDGFIDPRKFSKKYVIDCGQKFSPTILGCKGGSILDTLKFIGTGGLYNIDGWKVHRNTLLKKTQAATELDKRCPLDKFSTPVQQWGMIKVGMKPKRVSANEWLDALEDGPLVASVQMPSVGIETYEGGVHDGEGCSTSTNWHAMVLVGYGISPSGVPYWRFRNSWGPDWGDQGHFNLAMSVPAECLAGGVRVYREPVA